MTATLLFVAFAVLSLDSCLLVVRSFSAPSTCSFTRRKSFSRSTPDRRRRDPALQRRLEIGTNEKLLLICSKTDGTHDEGIQSTYSTSDHALQEGTPPVKATRWADVESDRDGQSAQAGQHTCSNCRRSFPTRNALFRHLRGLGDGGDSDDRGPYYEASSGRSSSCGGQVSASHSAGAVGEMGIARVPFRVAVQFGYYPQGPLSSANKSAAEVAASLIQQQLLTPPDSDDCTVNPAADEGTETSKLLNKILPRILNATLLSATQASDAKLRAACLRQETDCSAANDVLVLSCEVALATEPSSSGLVPTKAKLQSFVEQYVADRILSRGWSEANNLRVDAIKFLDKPLHAERSCSQYVYHYLMPSSWLIDPENEMAGWMEKERVTSSPRPNGFGSAQGGETNATARRLRRPPALVRLKQALRSMESPRLDASSTSLKEEDASPDANRRTGRRQRVAAGRFGGLAYKSRQAFHNYCDQQLMGAISPNHDVVWRCVDRARIVDFVTTNDEEKGIVGNDINVVLEFRGDGFLKHQIRTMIGTALSIANGWLPVDTTVPISTSPDHIVAPLPCAPAGRLYLAATRFHFEELSNSGKPLFDPGVECRVLLASQCRHTSNRNISNVQWIQRELMSRKNRLEEQRAEAEWLRSAETKVCHATRIALSASVDDSGLTSSTPHDALSHEPDAFSNVLTHLRSIAAGSWPETTAARSLVIRGDTGEDRREMCMGSFTVVNPALVNQDFHHLGNEMFPELVNAVFALEQILSEQERDLVMISRAHDTGTVHPSTLATSSRRPSSTHCAINSNAQFTPHVDSGRGLGQTMSMIVGLGDYTGGELMVEGLKHSIRYRAVEFDGWKLRHWTRPFHGERFSLVWFTPATGPQNGVAQ
jgi:tRNA U38,U39,U40 pseudouridine synthase TruA